MLYMHIYAIQYNSIKITEYITLDVIVECTGAVLDAPASMVAQPLAPACDWRRELGAGEG